MEMDVRSVWIPYIHQWRVRGRPCRFEVFSCRFLKLITLIKEKCHFTKELKVL